MSDFLTESANANNTFNELKQAVIDGANDQNKRGQGIKGDK